MHICAHSIYNQKQTNIYHDDISIDEIKKLNKNFKLTFDDGYVSIYKYKDILFKIKNKVIIFICPGFIEGDTNIWWFEIYDFIKNNNGNINFTFKNKKYKFSLKSSKEKDYCYKKLCTIFKQINQKKQDKLLNLIIKNRKKPDYRDKFLTWEMISELSKSPNVSIGSHTYSHLNLNNEDEKTTIFELKKSKEIIEKNINKECSYFAFPYGGRDSFNEQIIKSALKIGYKYIFTTEPKINLLKSKKQNIVNRITSSTKLTNNNLYLFLRYCIKSFKNTSI